MKCHVAHLEWATFVEMSQEEASQAEPPASPPPEPTTGAGEVAARSRERLQRVGRADADLGARVSTRRTSSAPGVGADCGCTTAVSSIWPRRWRRSSNRSRDCANSPRGGATSTRWPMRCTNSSRSSSGCWRSPDTSTRPRSSAPRARVFDLAQRPEEPPIADDRLADGSWAATLFAHVAPYSRDFAAYLGRALPPNHPSLRSPTTPSASERLVGALRVLDLAALDMSRRIPKVARYQALPSIEAVNQNRRAERDARRASDSLARMGIEATP